ncbi:hypothetical protein DS745_20120 [Anaerobacillus alkaliphilus]|uniref:RDD domain-containing protein n=1 Tax=Anaerobacillus alkaliphilus TaxID=1548597 RepID=A0A4V1LG59_9BACI|nr:RDD family protein [Anaerobacillus alkaliphilus]RXI98624.1 hypothetical protein DS745_20120 [Anaerobacillus alkaliphilus]
MSLNQKWIEKLTATHYRATPFSRLLGFIYDVLTMFFLWVIVGTITTSWMIITSNSPNDDFAYIRSYILEFEPHLFYTAILIQVLALLAYAFILPLTFKTHRTIGMMIAGIKFLDTSAKEISKSTFLKREALKWLFFPGFLLTLSKNKQSLADKVTNTFVTYY